MAAIYIPSKPHYENSPSFRKKMRNIFQKAPELFYKCSGAFWKKVLMKNKTVRETIFNQSKSVGHRSDGSRK